MAEPVNVTIGGEVIAVPPIMKFDVLERAWPLVQAWNAALSVGDDFGREVAAVGIISAALLKTRPELTPHEIKSRLAVALFTEDGAPIIEAERFAILLATSALLRASGLVSAGEARPPATPAAETTA